MSRRFIAFDRWSDFDESFDDWDGPTHGRPLGVVRSSLRVPRCHHWQEPVELLDDLTIYASALHDQPRQYPPLESGDVGFYLDQDWTRDEMLLCSPGLVLPFARRHSPTVVVYPWPDQGVPREPARFRRALSWLLEQLSEGARVEVGCLGGHGRTGSVLASLLSMQGLTPGEAIDYVRSRYCTEAIETKGQVQFIHRVAN